MSASNSVPYLDLTVSLLVLHAIRNDVPFSLAHGDTSNTPLSQSCAVAIPAALF